MFYMMQRCNVAVGDPNLDNTSKSNFYDEHDERYNITQEENFILSDIKLIVAYVYQKYILHSKRLFKNDSILKDNIPIENLLQNTIPPTSVNGITDKFVVLDMRSTYDLPATNLWMIDEKLLKEFIERKQQSSSTQNDVEINTENMPSDMYLIKIAKFLSHLYNGEDEYKVVYKESLLVSITKNPNDLAGNPENIRRLNDNLEQFDQVSSQLFDRMNTLQTNFSRLSTKEQQFSTEKNDKILKLNDFVRNNSLDYAQNENIFNGIEIDHLVSSVMPLHHNNVVLLYHTFF